jgi:site-specific DNA-methyltransferase (adenine-specific)
VSVHYSDDLVTLHHGDCINVMRELPEASVDAVVTDPPYGLEFMGKDWDAPWKNSGDVVDDPASVGGFQDGAGGNPFSRSRIRYGRDGNAMAGFQAWFTEVASEAHRVLKPGGHLLAFGGTRTWHRLAVAIEDAGFEVRDSIAWMYGSGFPKSLDVSKAIDKAAGAEREVVGSSKGVGVSAEDNKHGGINRGAVGIKQVAVDVPITAPATPAAQQWQGWGTALKPAFEPIVVARKPLIGTVAENVLAHGTGALNIDASRIGADGGGTHCTNRDELGKCIGHDNAGRSTSGATFHGDNTTAGRWPANVILDESQAAQLDKQSGVSGAKPERVGRKGGCNDNGTLTGYGSADDMGRWPGDSGGGASRFFYVPKANASERPREGDTAHPTVKPLDLMRYLIKLVTPPGGTVLEPFAGSGTTLEACVIEGFHVIGIELTEDYLPLIVQRVTKPTQQVMF